jgi:enediyne biosynthesis protein E3
LAGTLRSLRRRILTPDVSATKLDKRGFYDKSTEARKLLESVGQSFLTGYAYAAEARSPAEAHEQLETVPVQFRGFAYEGAAMSFTIMDLIPLGGRGRFSNFVSGPARDHIYMAYIGGGWALARLPRFLWPRLPELDPLLRWLVLDGYGFHQAYFHTAKYVHGQFQEPRFPWPADGPRWYADRAIDLGIGRAMWFVGGASADQVATLIERFPQSRRADLYSGAGLAATYAGGADEEELRLFAKRAGTHRAQVAQGSAFGATAREQAGLTTDHTRLATRVFCDMTPSQAMQVCAEAIPNPADSADSAVPAYEEWRQRIVGKLGSSAGPTR